MTENQKIRELEKKYSETIEHYDIEIRREDGYWLVGDGVYDERCDTIREIEKELEMMKEMKED